MRPRYRSRVSLNTKTTINKFLIAVLTFSLVIGFACYLVLNFGNTEEAKAAVTRESRAEITGTWENPDSWTHTSVPGAGDNYIINGYITKNSGLSLGNNQSLVIRTADTLVVNGDVFVDNNARLVIESNAVLVVRGSYKTHQQTSDQVHGNGTLIITGKITFLGEGSDLFIQPGGIVYHDSSVNGDIASRVNGGGSIGDLYSLPGNLFDLSGIRTLPVSIEKLWTRLNNRKIYINWITSNEKGIKKYQIQRSKTGNEFKTIGEVGLESDGNAYQYIDDNTYSGHWYYRIAMIEENNSIQYSSITEVDLEDGNNTPFTLFPTVCQGKEINFKGEEVQNKPVTIIVYDNNGRTIHEDYLETNGADSYKINFDQKLNRGNYFIHFVYDNKVDKQKFLVSY